MKSSKTISIILVTLLLLTASVIAFVALFGGTHPTMEMGSLRGHSDGFETIDTSTNRPPTVTVDKGDTLWQIMREHYGNKVHGQKAVYEIREFNDIDPHHYIQPGMEIKLPEIE